MAKTHTLTINYSDGYQTINQQISKSDDRSLELDVTVAANVTNQAHAFPIDVSEVKSMYLMSTQNITIKTNSTSTPANTLNLLANRPVIWQDGDLNSLLLTTDVTTLYLTTGAISSSASLKLLLLTNA